MNNYSYIHIIFFFFQNDKKKNELKKNFHNKNVIIMQKEKYIKEFLEFIKNGSCTYTATEFMKKELIQLGFQELLEENVWHLTSGDYFVIRNDASIIAFSIGKNYHNSFNIITTHSDTPSLFIKPKNELFENGYLKINVAPYGGLLNYGWLDRPLSIAGKIVWKKENTFLTKIIDLKEPYFVIPSLAIHQNDQANSNLDLNTQIDLIPILSLKEEKNVIRNMISDHTKIPKEELFDYDLHLYNVEEPFLIGKEKDILLSPRIDNLTSSFAAFKSLIKSKNEKNINVFCSFNSEEIGSLTKEGADSNFLLDTLKKIGASLKIDISTTLHQSFIISSDNTHANHPNHPDKSDDSNKIYLNKGIVISKEISSTTDSLSSSIFKSICNQAKIPFQDYTSRNDLASGSTLAGISLRHISTLSIDVGLAELAMHSSYECIGLHDIYSLYQVFLKFYQTSLKRKENSTIIFK